MTQDLFRKEALQHRDKSLYGDVVLSSPPGTWLITLLLVGILVLIGAFLFFGRVNIDGNSISVLAWLMSRGG